ncbi:MAG: hypothetical protein ABL927_00215 [Bdellovibrionales bacterium]
MKISVTLFALLLCISAQAADNGDSTRNAINQSIIDQYIPKALQTNCIVSALSAEIDAISRFNRNLYKDVSGSTFISNIAIQRLTLENTQIKEGILYAVKVEDKFSDAEDFGDEELILVDPVPRFIGSDPTNGRAGSISYLVLETNNSCQPKINIRKM